MTDLTEQVSQLDADAKTKFFQQSLEQLTIGECLALVKHLEDEWDVDASPGFGGIQPRLPDEGQDTGEEQTEFDLIVTELGQERIKVIKEVRKLLDGGSLKDARDAVNNLPATVKSKMPKEAAEAAKQALTGAGATIELK